MANGLLGLFQPQPDQFQTLLGEYYDPKTSRMKWLGGSLQGLGAGLASGRPGAWAQGLAMGGGEALEDYQKQALLGYQMAQRQEEQDYQRGRDATADERWQMQYDDTRSRQQRADAWQNTQMDWQMQDRQQQEDMRLGQQNQVQDWMGGFEAQGGNLFSPEMQQGLRQQGIQGVDPRDTQKYDRMQPLAGAGMYPQAFEQMMAEPAPMEAPQIQKFREVDPVTGEPVEITAQWSNGQWVEIGRGPAFNPKSGVTVNNLPAGQDPPDADLRKKLSENEAETWTNYTVAADQSGALVQQLQIVDELAKTAPQGPISGRLATMFPGVSTSGDAFNSIVTRIAPSLRTPGSGSQSDREFEAFLTSMPRLQNTPGGNAIISAVLQAKAELDVRRGDIVSAYSNGEISAVEARKQLGALRRESILTPEMQQIIGGSGGGTEVDDLLEKYGGEE
jgi:hypothetical protein